MPQKNEKQTLEIIFSFLFFRNIFEQTHNMRGQTNKTGPLALCISRFASTNARNENESTYVCCIKATRVCRQIAE